MEERGRAGRGRDGSGGEESEWQGVDRKCCRLLSSVGRKRARIHDSGQLASSISFACVRARVPAVGPCASEQPRA